MKAILHAASTRTRQFHGLPPNRFPSDYWIIRCDKGLIRGDGDVWSTTTMEMYSACTGWPK